MIGNTSEVKWLKLTHKISKIKSGFRVNDISLGLAQDFQKPTLVSAGEDIEDKI